MSGKRGRPPKIKEGSMVSEKLIIDDYTEKPLSELILEIRELIKCYQNQISIKTFEKNGKISEIEITARIQL